jgi:hypothetical protein
MTEQAQLNDAERAQSIWSTLSAEESPNVIRELLAIGDISTDGGQTAAFSQEERREIFRGEMEYRQAALAFGLFAVVAVLFIGFLLCAVLAFTKQFDLLERCLIGSGGIALGALTRFIPVPKWGGVRKD